MASRVGSLSFEGRQYWVISQPKLEEKPPKPVLLAGYATALAGVGIGIGFLLVRDEASFELTPSESHSGGDKTATLVPAVHGTF